MRNQREVNFGYPNKNKPQESMMRETQVEQEEPYKLTPTDIKLINEGCVLKKVIDEKEERLSRIKELITHIPKGWHKTVEGGALQVTLVDEFTPIDPREVKEHFSALKRPKDFIKVVSINITELRKFLGDTDVAGFRTKKGEQRRLSFR
jgi:hypothetical protein